MNTMEGEDRMARKEEEMSEIEEVLFPGRRREKKMFVVLAVMMVIIAVAIYSGLI